MTLRHCANDYLDRASRAVRAANKSSVASQTLFTYTNSNTIITTMSDEFAYLDQNLLSTKTLDGLGREIESRTYEDGGSYISVDRTYDAAGRPYQVSNPYRPGDPVLWTTTTYDSLNRMLNVTGPDGGATVYSYANNQTTVTDPAGKDRTTTTDALGRLTQVNENPSGVNYATTYSYNVLDNLLTVHQPGGLTDRSFSYDWLQRLTSASNPESGTVYSSYDNNGNLLTKTDARGVQTGFAYDRRQRPALGVPAGATPAAWPPAWRST